MALQPGIRELRLPSFGQSGQSPTWTSPTSRPGGMAPSQGAYSAAVTQQGGDYDTLMGNYGNLYSKAMGGANGAELKPMEAKITPASYNRTGDFGNAINKARDFSETGGYSDDDIGAFRGRGLAPIRSIYATALNNLKRQRSLSGGYSPNFGAIQAKMARDQSSQIGQHTLDLNAKIAEQVQAGKLAGLGQYGNMSQAEQGMIQNTNSQNATMGSNVSQFNAKMLADMQLANEANKGNYMQQALSANNAAANLYGTTPALVNTFGNQVLQSNAQKLQGQQAEASIRQNAANTGTPLSTPTLVKPRSVLPAFGRNYG